MAILTVFQLHIFFNAIDWKGIDSFSLQSMLISSGEITATNLHVIQVCRRYLSEKESIAPES